MNSNHTNDNSVRQKALRKKLFDDWNGLTIMCPENINERDLYLQGVISGMKSSHISF